MRKTVTDAMLEQMRKACADMCRNGKCTMECDVDGARLGWCADVWAVTRKGE